MTSHRTYLSSMALFWLAFGVGTAFYPRMMQLFMTPEGVAASTSFSDHVWLHDGLDIISVCVLLFALSRLPATPATLRLSALVGLLPALGIANGVLMTRIGVHFSWCPASVASLLRSGGLRFRGERPSP